jgi:hypothetical protein
MAKPWLCLCLLVIVHLPMLPVMQDAIVSLLLLLSNADALVKGYMCTKDTLQQHLDCLSKLQPPALVRVRGKQQSRSTVCIPHLSGFHSSCLCTLPFQDLLRAACIPGDMPHRLPVMPV